MVSTMSSFLVVSIRSVCLSYFGRGPTASSWGRSHPEISAGNLPFWFQVLLLLGWLALRRFAYDFIETRKSFLCLVMVTSMPVSPTLLECLLVYFHHPSCDIRCTWHFSHWATETFPSVCLRLYYPIFTSVNWQSITTRDSGMVLSFGLFLISSLLMSTLNFFVS